MRAPTLRSGAVRVPPVAQRRLLWIMTGTLIVVAAACFAALTLTEFRTGFAPSIGVYRSGTATVSGPCEPLAGQLGTAVRCPARVNWDSAARPGLAVTDAPQVWVTSRHRLTGPVPVVSRKAYYTSRLGGAIRYQASAEVIMPADQPPLPSAAKAGLVIAAIAISIGAVVVVGRVARGPLLRAATRTAAS